MANLFTLSYLLRPIPTLFTIVLFEIFGGANDRVNFSAEQFSKLNWPGLCYLWSSSGIQSAVIQEKKNCMKSRRTIYELTTENRMFAWFQWSGAAGNASNTLM